MDALAFLLSSARRQRAYADCCSSRRPARQSRDSSGTLATARASEVFHVDIGYLQFASARMASKPWPPDNAAIVKIQAGDGVVAFGALGAFPQWKWPSLGHRTQQRHTVPDRAPDSQRSPRRFESQQKPWETCRRYKNIIPQDQGHRVQPINDSAIKKAWAIPPDAAVPGIRWTIPRHFRLPKSWRNRGKIVRRRNQAEIPNPVLHQGAQG